MLSVELDIQYFVFKEVSMNRFVMSLLKINNFAQENTNTSKHK